MKPKRRVLPGSRVASLGTTGTGSGSGSGGRVAAWLAGDGERESSRDGYGGRDWDGGGVGRGFRER